MSLNDLIRSCIHTGASTNDGIKFSVTPHIRDAVEINTSRLGIFLEGLCDIVQKSFVAESQNDDSQRFQLYEVSGENCSLTVRFHLRFGLINGEVDEDPLGSEFVTIALHSIQNVMRETLQISPNLSELVSTLFESPIREENGCGALELEFRFPFCKISRSHFNGRMKSLIETEFRQRRLFDFMKIHPIGDWSDIVQEMGPLIPFYGSIGLNGSPPMTFVTGYGVCDTHQPVQTFDPQEVVFDPSHHSWFFSRRVNPDILERHDKEFWLPLFFSVHFWLQQCPLSIDESETGSNVTIAGQTDGHNIKSNLHHDMIHFLLPLLSDERAKSNSSWNDVGCIIYGIYGEISIEGFEMWVKFSERAGPNHPCRDRFSCERKWVQFSSGLGVSKGLTIRTIAAYARHDNPLGYRAWHDAWTADVFIKATSKVQEEVAELVYRVFWLDYVFTGAPKGEWYKYDASSSHMRKSPGGLELRTDITNVILRRYRELLANRTAMAAATAADPGELGKSDAEVRLISGIIKSLGTTTFKNGVVAFCQEKFHRHEVAGLLDTNPFTIAWTNCVTEVCDKKVGDDAHRAHANEVSESEVLIRHGKMEDFITKSTLIPLRTYSWTDPLVCELMEWLGKTFPIRELLHFFLKLCASFLLGRNAEKYFIVWSGDGNNSKSMVVKLIMACLAIYAINFPVELLSAKRQGGGPTPELAQAKSSHAAFVSEAESKDDLRAGTVKRLTGGDNFFARMCNENGGSITATFKLIFMCNRIPNIDGADGATIERFLHLPFLSTFVDEPPASVEEQYRQRKFLKDPHFESKIPHLARAMAWVMTQYYPIYIKEGLLMPEVVKQHTAAYWEATDSYRLFIQERLEMSYISPDVINTQASLTASEIYNSIYKAWYKDNYPGSEVPSSADFKREMCQARRLGPQDRQRWWGIQIRPIVSNINM